jgi:carboxypeptidase C (cathepsin A)
MILRKTTLSLLSLVCAVLIVQAQDNVSQVPNVASSTQRLTINGENMELKTRAGTMLIRDENNIPIANFGFTSYSKRVNSKTGGTDKTRPIMFAYNGGPGSSSFWLHMGVLGPKRIVVDDPNFNKAAPYQLVNNEYSVLDIADLVMIDPVGTGLSVPVGDSEFSDFWGVDQDIRSISLFITQYLIANGRMNSPKYLLGESYGTFRNAGVMNRLLSQGIALNGVIMVSAVFDLRTLMFPPNDDMPYIVHLPTYAATAWYHKKANDNSANLEAFVDKVRRFTKEVYLPALFEGDALDANTKNTVAQNLANFTGISADYWLMADLRVTASEFFAEFLRANKQTVGRLDSRYTGISQDGIAQNGAFDPQSSAISPAYIQSFLNYLHEDLRVSKELTYSITAGRRPGFEWDWSHQGNGGWGNSMAAINTGPDMAQALSRDPNLKVLILNGYYDVATVFYGVEHSIDHLGLSPEIRDNIIMKYYEAGHMMYTHEPSLIKFKKDVAEFINNTSN